MSIDSFIESGNSLRFQMMQVIFLSKNTRKEWFCWEI